MDASEIEKLTVPKLKEELKKRGKALTGLKAELKARLVEALGEEVQGHLADPAAAPKLGSSAASALASVAPAGREIPGEEPKVGGSEGLVAGKSDHDAPEDVGVDGVEVGDFLSPPAEDEGAPAAALALAPSPSPPTNELGEIRKRKMPEPAPAPELPATQSPAASVKEASLPPPKHALPSPAATPPPAAKAPQPSSAAAAAAGDLAGGAEPSVSALDGEGAQPSAAKRQKTEKGAAAEAEAPPGDSTGVAAAGDAAATKPEGACRTPAAGGGGGGGGGGSRAFTAALAATTAAARPGAPNTRAPAPAAAAGTGGTAGSVSSPAGHLKPAETPSRAVRVDGLTRPFTIKQLKEQLLAPHGKFQDEDVWMPQLKTHCVVIYEHEDMARPLSEAAAARQALDGVQWPSGYGKVLAARFVSVEDAKAIISGTAVAQTMSAAPAAAVAAGRGLAAAVAAGVAAAISGQDKRMSAAGLAKAEQSPMQPGSARGARTPMLPLPAPKSLDELFLKTVAKPSLYYLPVTPAELQRRAAQRSRAAQPPKSAAAGEGTPLAKAVDAAAVSPGADMAAAPAAADTAAASAEAAAVVAIEGESR